MYNFQAVIHALPAAATLESPVTVDGLPLAIVSAGQAMSHQQFAVSFEEAGESLEKLPRMYFERDGSFVWVGTEPAAWQVDGVMYDRDGRLLYVEIKGSCPVEQFDQFLSALGWPATRLVFQLTQAAIFVAEAEFRRWAARGSE